MTQNHGLDDELSAKSRAPISGVAAFRSAAPLTAVRRGLP